MLRVHKHVKSKGFKIKAGSNQKEKNKLLKKCKYHTKTHWWLSKVDYLADKNGEELFYEGALIEGFPIN